MRPSLRAAVVLGLAATLMQCSREATESAAALSEPAPVADADSLVAWTLAGYPDSFEAPGLRTDARRIARTVRVTSEWYGMRPQVIARLIYVESYGDSAAVHRPITVRAHGRLVRTRAVGLGGIVPELWLGTFPECGDDLATVRTNVCYTVLVYRWFRSRHADAESALLAYNGCRRGWSCDWYAAAILSQIEDD